MNREEAIEKSAKLADKMTKEIREFNTTILKDSFVLAEKTADSEAHIEVIVNVMMIWVGVVDGQLHHLKSLTTAPNLSEREIQKLAIMVDNAFEFIRAQLSEAEKVNNRALL